MCGHNFKEHSILIFIIGLIVSVPYVCFADQINQGQSSSLRKTLNNSLNEVANSLIESSVKNLSEELVNSSQGSTNNSLSQNTAKPSKKKKAKKRAGGVNSQIEANYRPSKNIKGPDVSIITKEEAEDEMNKQRKKKIIVD